jgi:hypothetical protein
VAAGSGPVTPANGATSFNGAQLAAGDLVVFDGTVVNPNAGSADAWGAVELNQAGYLGLTGAALGAKVETASSYTSAMWIGGNGLDLPAGAGSFKTNRLRIELTATTAGSASNMSWVAKLDQGLTGAFSSTLSGLGATFANNTIGLTFGANTSSHIFSPYISPLPPELAWQPEGGALRLSWPSDHLGWSLQTQTNSLLATNWITVPGSTLTNACVVPIGATNQVVFFRLCLP